MVLINLSDSKEEYGYKKSFIQKEKRITIYFSEIYQ